MRKILTSAVVAAVASMASAAFAQTATSDFNVSVTLTSQCTATNSGATTVDFGTYTAFQAGAQGSNTVNLGFTCTRGFVPASVAFDVVNGTAGGVGVLQGLQYTLTAGAPVLAAGIPATTATIGTGDTRTYPVSGSMPGLQAGNCVGASCGPTSHVRTLILTY